MLALPDTAFACMETVDQALFWRRLSVILP
jgi:hypothetical protein